MKCATATTVFVVRQAHILDRACCDGAYPGRNPRAVSFARVQDEAGVTVKCGTNANEDVTMQIRENLWLPIAFAAVVSAATPMSSLRDLPHSLQQMNFKLVAFDMPHGITEHSISGVIQLTVAYFPVLHALVVVGAFGAYLAATRTFGLRGFLYGLATGLLGLSFGFAGVIALLISSTLHVPQPIFYYVVLRLPTFFGLVLPLWIAHYKVRLKDARDKSVRNLSSKLA